MGESTHRFCVAVLASGLAACSFPRPADLPEPGDDAGGDQNGSDANGNVDGGQPAGPCTPNTTVCADDTTISCDAQGHPTPSNCGGFGCWDTTAGTAAATGDQCADLAPSNGLGQMLDGAATAPVADLSDGATIDTDTGIIVSNGQAVVLPHAVISQPGTAVQIRVFAAKRLSMRSTTVNGTHALAFVVDEAIQITGELKAAVAVSRGIVGATFDAMRCSAKPGISGGSSGFGSGGGGAGYGIRGGSGGTASFNAGGAGGAVIDTDLQPLVGGCPGAWGSPDNPATAGGIGGGAIQLVSRTSISVAAAGANAGRIHVGGGGGGMNDDTERAKDGGGGGGSGGAVLLEAPVVVLAGAGSLIAANGGGGAAGGTCSNDGLGHSATASTNVAPGGQGCRLSGTFTGEFGNGAFGAAGMAVVGAPAPALGAADFGAAGGGGGGLGYLVVRNATSQFAAQDGATLSAVLKQLPLRKRPRS